MRTIAARTTVAAAIAVVTAAFAISAAPAPAQADVPSTGLDDSVTLPIPTALQAIADAADTTTTPSVPPLSTFAAPALNYRVASPDSSPGLGPVVAGVLNGASGTAGPAQASLAAPALTTAASANFAGLGTDSVNTAPADVNAAAGPSDVLETTNTGIALYSRIGTLQYSTSLDAWFGGTGNFDPHVYYEPLGQRFIAVTSAPDRTLRIRVSDDSSAAGSWCGYNLANAVPAGHLADFPLIGSNQHLFMVTVADFDGASPRHLKDARIYQYPRSAIEACGGSVSGYYYKGLRDPNTGNVFQGDQVAAPIVPVTDSSEENDAYLVDSYASGGSHVTLWRIDTNNQALYAHKTTTQQYQPPDPVPQPGTTHRLDPGDSRITQAVAGVYGIYVALTSKYDWGGGNVNSIVSWMQLDPVNGQQQIRAYGGFGRSGTWFFYPAVAMSHNGSYMFSFSESSGSEYPYSGYVGMDYSGVRGTTYYLAQGSYSYALIKSDNCSDCYRWGDYGSSRSDPANPESFIVSQESTTATDRWGTQVALMSFS